MPRFTDHYSGPPVTGEVAGGLEEAALPDLPAKMVNIKALPGNTGIVYVGPAGVTVPDGSDSPTSGWPLAPGDETGFLPAFNLSQLSRICENAGDSLVYLAWS